jgi:hypothetical protein
VPLGSLLAPLGPLLAPLGPKSEKSRLGNELGENSESKSDFIWSLIFKVFPKKRFWAVFFEVCFSELFFYGFLAAPGCPVTMKIMQNPCTVARKLGLAKIRNFSPGVDFWLHFGSHFGAFGHHFRPLLSFVAFCFATLLLLP